MSNPTLCDIELMAEMLKHACELGKEFRDLPFFELVTKVNSSALGKQHYHLRGAYLVALTLAYYAEHELEKIPDLTWYKWCYCSELGYILRTAGSIQARTELENVQSPPIVVKLNSMSLGGELRYKFVADHLSAYPFKAN